MAGRRSAGILLYRQARGELEVFLVHPGGPFWVKKDAGAWSIPKGELAEGDDPLEAAKREFLEETGSAVDGSFTKLTPVKQKGGKVVHAWAIAGDMEPASLRSNTFAMEWPPKSGKQAEFPEVDRGEWFTLAAAREKIQEGQRGLLDELHGRLRPAP